MTKSEIADEILKIGKTVGAGYRVTAACIEMADKMAVLPSVRPIVDDEQFGAGIAFDYDGENGVSVEIFVSHEEIGGYMSYFDDEVSNFVFESKDDAVNFWNVAVRMSV